MLNYIIAFTVFTKNIAAVLAFLMMIGAVWKQFFYAIHLKLKWHGKVIYNARASLFQKPILMQFLTAFMLCGVVYVLDHVTTFFK